MNIRAVILCPALLLAGPLLARESTDVIKFNKTNLDVTATLLPAVSEPGRVYFSSNVSYYIKITGNLSWNVSLYANYDNRPPGNLPGSDYGTSSGLAWTFGSSLRTTPTTQ